MLDRRFTESAIVSGQLMTIGDRREPTCASTSGAK
jgi:hypothetical protein